MLHVLPPTFNLSCNKSSCCRFYIFCNKHVARFTGPRQTCFAASDLSPVCGVVLVQFYLSNQKSEFTQLAVTFICGEKGLNVGGKTCNIAFQLDFQQCCKTSCTFLLPLLPRLKPVIFLNLFRTHKLLERCFILLESRKRKTSSPVRTGA